MYLYLIRHGITEWNNQRRFQGQADIPMSPAGIKQIEKLANRLEGEPGLLKLYCSKMKRAMMTADIIGRKLDMVPVAVPNLEEISVGGWSGRGFDEIEREESELYYKWQSGESTFCIPGGESTAQVQKRAVDEIMPLIENETGSILLVAHGIVIKTILCALMNFSLERAGDFEMTNASLSVIQYERGKHSKLIIWNDTSHLRS